MISIPPNGKMSNEEHRMILLTKLLTKVTVLVIFSALSTIILTFTTVALSILDAGLPIDGLLNGLCALYCFTIYEKQYKKYCFLCHKVGFRICMCLLFKNDANNNININNHRKQNKIRTSFKKQQKLTSQSKLTLAKDRSESGSVSRNDNNDDFKSPTSKQSPSFDVNEVEAKIVRVVETEEPQMQYMTSIKDMIRLAFASPNDFDDQ